MSLLKKIILLACLLPAITFAAETLSAQEVQFLKKQRDEAVAMFQKKADAIYRQSLLPTELKVKHAPVLSARLAALVSDCDNGPDPGEVGEVSCWDRCTKDGGSTYYCNTICGSDSGGGTAECWDSCTKQGGSTYYCQTICK